MEPIAVTRVQTLIDSFARKDVYLHLETTNGAYASHFDQSFFSAGAYIRNAHINYKHGKIIGDGPYRVGLELNIGWVYGEGLTHFELNEDGQLILAGLNHEDKIAVTLEISEQPFRK
ncbi:YojF family protein [Salicibibacter cibi]|uniref:YojF family protein n=1 Tax=Salicibibacter cibi TaxID=2743001 RepID=A0A7T6Z911_9BACI|nr:YojF family protein [Salicibibacter cibi]QQK79056.1 YojF family protein [Salicibibacter cibi]